MEAADTRPRSSRRRQHRTMRTEASNDGDIDFLRSGASLPTETSRRTQKKPLNFYHAMSDFQTMFPHIEKDVIEAVLRANDGVVQTTIDQLLDLSQTAEDESPAADDHHPPGYHESPDFSNDLPPSYDEVENEILSEFAREAQEFENRRQSCTSPIPDLSSPITDYRTRRWNPPMIGDLPPDFLRISDDQPMIDAPDGLAAVAGGLTEPNRDGFLTDKDLDQFLEDEKLAMFLQNEEFMRQLRHDPDFLMSLEEDYRKFEQTRRSLDGPAATPSEQGARGVAAYHGGARPRNSPAAYDDAVFNKKLKHMGKTTRKKFSKIAKRFSRKKSPKFTPLGASTANLLEEEPDDYDGGPGNTWLENIKENDNGDDTLQHNSIPEVKESVGRKLPQAPSGAKRTTNAEPIVFYSEDNEFEYKHDY